MPGYSLMIRLETAYVGLSPAEIAHLREAYGADRPVILQFFTTLGAFLTGDFGYSIATGTPVSELITDALPGTAALAGTAFFVAVLLAGLITLLAATPRPGWLSQAFANLPSLSVAVAGLWLGTMLVQSFSSPRGWISVITPGPVEGLILPVLTIAVPISAPIAQILLRSMDEVRTAPFITVVRAKGASESWILWRNVFKNALLPTITVAGVLFGELVGGAVVTETIFGRNGIGRIAEQAVANQDTVEIGRAHV